jgi:hypothetical protein
MELSDDQKRQTLMVVLQERYNASHKMRERSVQFTLWISGMAIPIGWLLISQQQLVFTQRLALTLFIVALFGGTIWFLLGLKRGFQKNREVMIGCEQVLGLYEEGKYLADRALLSLEYCRPGWRWSDHFSTLSVWLVTVAMSLLLLTWMAPAHDKNRPNIIQVEQFKGEKVHGKPAQ